MDWTVEDGMVDGLFCDTLTGCRGGHTPFVQAGAETSDTGAKAVELDPCSSWEGHTRWCVPVTGIKVQSLVGLSAHSAFHWWSAHCAARMLLSEKLMSCCAAGTNVCLDLWRYTAAPDGRVSAERSRCPGSMAWHPMDSMAPLRRSSAGWMPARIGRLSAGVGRRHPVTRRKVLLMVGSIRQAWALRHQTGAQYSPTAREEPDCFLWVVQQSQIVGCCPGVQALTIRGCCNPSWRAGNWSRQHTGWGVGTSGWSLEWVVSMEVCRRWWSCILWRLRTTTQSLIVLETDQPVTIPTAHGQTWQGRDSFSGLTQLVRSRESLAYLQLCSGSPAGRWWKPCSYRLAASLQ